MTYELLPDTRVPVRSWAAPVYGWGATRRQVIDHAYVAGFFDGEGSLGIYKAGKRWFELRAQLVQNYSPEADMIFGYLELCYGGNVSVRKLNKTVLHWQVSGPRAAWFLIKILPYLRLKTKQAEVAIEWQTKRPDRVGKSWRMSEEEITENIRVADLLKKLKG